MFDLSVILVLQVAALAYGCYVMFDARPVYNVFIVDRFDLIAANQIDAETALSKAPPEFQSLPLTGPRVIAARRIDDPNRQCDITMECAQRRPGSLRAARVLCAICRFRGAGGQARPAACRARKEAARPGGDDPQIRRGFRPQGREIRLPRDEGAQRGHDRRRGQGDGRHRRASWPSTRGSGAAAATASRRIVRGRGRITPART